MTPWDTHSLVAECQFCGFTMYTWDDECLACGKEVQS